MKFAHRYKLLKPFPGHAVGDEITWDGNSQRFYFWKPRKIELSLSKIDFDGMKFTVEQAQDRKWFKPLGESRDFIPAFPSKTKIEEFVCLIPDCRLVNNVDECRAINSMLEDREFQSHLYDFYKSEYEAFHKLAS